MTDSLSLKSKPGAAIFMALALITTTFAGVSFADPADGTEPMNTFLTMDYDQLEIIVDFDSNGTDYGTMNANFSLSEAGISDIILLEGSSSLMEETDNTSWNTHWADWDLTYFFENIAEDGIMYTVEVNVHAEDSIAIGYNWIDICMSNGSVCEGDGGQTNDVLSPEEEQQMFDDIDADGDGAISEQEFLDFVNMDRMNQNGTAMNSTEESEALSLFNMYDLGFQGMNDTEDANDSMLEFNEFMDLYYSEHDNSGEQSSGEMLLMMYDADMDGNLTLEELLNGINTDNENNGLGPLDNMTIQMFTGMFTNEDLDGNAMLNGDELDNFLDAMMNLGDGGNTEMSETEQMMMMLDTDSDNNISFSELTMNTNSNNDTLFMNLFTNLFAIHDEDSNNLLNLSELENFFEQMDELDTEICNDVMAGDVIMEDGKFWDADDYVTYLMVGDSAPSDGKFCYQGEQSSEQFMLMLDANGDGEITMNELMAMNNNSNSNGTEEQRMFGWMFQSADGDQSNGLDQSELSDLMLMMNSDEGYEPTPGQMLTMLDANGDGTLSLAEIIGYINAMNTADSEEPLSEVETEYIGIVFMMNDEDGNGLIDVNEFPRFFNDMKTLEDDKQGHDDNQGHDDENNSTGGENNDTQPDDENTMIESNQVDVWFEQWDNENMELVIVELITVDSADEIARLVNMADAEYGNNDSTLDQAEINMLMGLYALTLNPDEMANGLALDGQNGTAVDFWIEVDGLLEGDDVVFLRIGTVIEFPTGAYDNSTSHTFTVAPEMDEHADNSENVNSDCGKTNVWIHNSDTWNVKTATGFTFDERNNAWYSVDRDCQNHDVITFELEKAENGALPAAEEEDWTWEDEEMNMFPICDWSYSVTFENGSSMSEQGVDKAPESGDYEIVLDDNAAYEIFLFCWDPEGGKMTVDIGSILGNSTNSSVGETMGAISFKLLAGTGGNFTFAFSWTDEYHTESGTLTVIATGDGTIDLTDIEVDGEGILPGFTVGLGVLAMLGAAMFAGRRNEA